MANEYFQWFSALAVIIACILLWRGERILKLKIISRFLIALYFLFLALILLPKEVTRYSIKSAAAIIIILSSLIIIFDALQILLKKAQAVFYNSPFSKTLPGYITEICQALEILAGASVGALVVIERRNNIDEFLGASLGFDAEVKAEVLAALFQKNSVVHDGAVIVRGGRIARVRAVLPVSANEALPDYLGTRHRAAVGITEASDVIVLMVSEQRGEISIAFRGSIVKVNSQKDLNRLFNKALKGKNLVKVIKGKTKQAKE